jgi:hypothetical protein
MLTIEDGKVCFTMEILQPHFIYLHGTSFGEYDGEQIK